MNEEMVTITKEEYNELLYIKENVANKPAVIIHYNTCYGLPNHLVFKGVEGNKELEEIRDNYEYAVKQTEHFWIGKLNDEKKRRETERKLFFRQSVARFIRKKYFSKNQSNE